MAVAFVCALLFFYYIYCNQIGLSNRTLLTVVRFCTKSSEIMRLMMVYYHLYTKEEID